MEYDYEENDNVDETEEQNYEYPDPEVAQYRPWPAEYLHQDIIRPAARTAVLERNRSTRHQYRESSGREEEGKGSYGQEIYTNLIDTIDPNAHFALLDAYGQPRDKDHDYVDESAVSDESISDSGSGPDDLFSPRQSPRGRGRGKERGRGGRGGRGRGGRGSRRSVAERQHRDEAIDVLRGRRRGRGKGRGGAKGFRKPVEPSAEFKALRHQANVAFINGDYQNAEELITQAISHNPEIFEAHALLSEVYLAQNDAIRSVSALYYGAHTRPRGLESWNQAADQIERIAQGIAKNGFGQKATDHIERGDESAEKEFEDYLKMIDTAITCYGRVISLDKGNNNALEKRAALLKERGKIRLAIEDYEQLRERDPHNNFYLQNLADAYVLNDDVASAVECCETSIALVVESDPDELQSFSWSEIDVYATVFLRSEDMLHGLKSIKKLSRWMLGRIDDTFWEDYKLDDREFDLDHDPRRRQFLAQSDEYPLSNYGEGLPLDIRIKLGCFRIKMGPDHLAEALMHFSHLEELPDQFYLLREAADALRTQGHFREALRYYEPIRSSDTQLDRQFFRDLLQCYRELGMVEEVEECWRILARSRQGDSDLAGRHELIRFLIEAGQEDRIAPYQAELAWKRRRKFKLMTGLNHRDSDLSLETPSNDMELLDDNLHSKCDPYANPIPGTQGRRKGVMPSLEEQEDVEPIFAIMRDLKARLDDGDAEARTRWKRHAYSLVEVFRQATVFFPYDRNVKFFGYSAEARQRAMATKKRVQEMDEERAVQLVIPLSQLPPPPPPPRVFNHVNFDRWLDVFLEFSIILAEDSDARACYTTLDLVAACNVWYHSKESMFLIHIVWAICALLLSDTEKLSSVTRFFMLEYQFVTDSYRLHCALQRLASRPNRYFTSAPLQKFLLRQIKTIDLCVLPEDSARRRALEKNSNAERARLSTKDENGNEVRAKDLDTQLLVLYGQTLLASGSAVEALNYFYRALALDGEHPLINLELALCYLEFAIKRQSPNRHNLIMQGLSFLYRYKELRKQQAKSPVEKQEAEFNVARAFHMLGLQHIAVPGYEKVLRIGEEIRREWEEEDKREEEKKDQEREEEVRQNDVEGDEDIVMESIETPSDAFTRGGPNDFGAAQNHAISEMTDRRRGEGKSRTPMKFREDFTVDAAYALQELHASVGNMEKAQAIVDRYMVL